MPIPPLDALTRQLLAWAQACPRTYREAMETWSTFCPTWPVWEDALDAGLIEVAPAPGARIADRPVRLTPAGRAWLERH